MKMQILKRMLTVILLIVCLESNVLFANHAWCSIREGIESAYKTGQFVIYAIVVVVILFAILIIRLILKKNRTIQTLDTSLNEPPPAGGPGHHWGKYPKTHNIVKTCPECNGIFHGAEFEECGECRCNLEIVSKNYKS